MKKLEKLTLKELGESTHVLNPVQAASLIAGSGSGTYNDPYQLEEVVFSAYRSSPGWSVNTYDLIAYTAMNQGTITVYNTDYNGGPVPINFGTAGNDLNLSDEEKRSIFNIVSEFILTLVDRIGPVFVGGEDFWRNYFGIDEPDEN